MAQDAKPTQAPLLCATGCGFYGNPRTNGMCSVCYRDSLQRHTVAVRVGEPVPASLGSVEASPSTQPPPAMAGPALDENSQDPAEEADTQVEPAPGTFQAEPKTEDIAGSSELVEDTSRRGKRKCEEPLQLDADSGEGSGGTETEISVEPSTAELEKSKPKKSRCFTCRKKVGLTGFDCRCGNVFCGVHRYSDVHNCTFDYKADAAQKIRKENPVIVGEKITKI